MVFIRSSVVESRSQCSLAIEAAPGFKVKQIFSKIFHMRNGISGKRLPVPSILDRQFAEFLKRRRGTLTYAAFARKTGLSPSTLFRLENGEQSITLLRLDAVLKRLKANMADVFSAGTGTP